MNDVNTEFCYTRDQFDHLIERKGWGLNSKISIDTEPENSINYQSQVRTYSCTGPVTEKDIQELQQLVEDNEHHMFEGTPAFTNCTIIKNGILCCGCLLIITSYWG